MRVESTEQLMPDAGQNDIDNCGDREIVECWVYEC